MQTKPIFHGVPQTIAHDCWWVDAPAAKQGPPDNGNTMAAKMQFLRLFWGFSG